MPDQPSGAAIGLTDAEVQWLIERSSHLRTLARALAPAYIKREGEIKELRHENRAAEQSALALEHSLAAPGEALRIAVLDQSRSVTNVFSKPVVAAAVDMALLANSDVCEPVDFAPCHERP
jgi:hypothetical protein